MRDKHLKPLPHPKKQPVKSLRKVDMVKLPLYSFFYKEHGTAEYLPAKIRFELSIKTKHTAQHVYGLVLDALQWYMGSGNRHFNLLKDADLLDAGYWAGHFCKLIVKKYHDLDIELKKTTVYDDRASIELTGKALIRPPGTFRP